MLDIAYHGTIGVRRYWNEEAELGTREPGTRDRVFEAPLFLRAHGQGMVLVRDVWRAPSTLKSWGSRDKPHPRVRFAHTESCTTKTLPETHGWLRSNRR